MNTIAFLQLQSVQLRHLLEKAGDDPVLKPQLQIRLTEIENRLSEDKQRVGSLFPRESVALPRAALFLSGGEIRGSVGIRPILAGQALIQYEGMFLAQALHDERRAAKAAGRQRRPRGAPKPELLFTGTPRGSFGLEFVPQLTDDISSAHAHAKSLENVANAIVLVTESDSNELDMTIGEIPHGVIPYLQRFLTVLSEHDAELRLAFSDKPSKSLKSDRIKRAAERLARDVKIEVVEILGVFRGLTRESGYFDLKMTDGVVISGNVADELSEDDIERIDSLTNKECLATLEQTTVTKITGAVTYTHILLGAEPVTLDAVTENEESL